MVIAWITLYGLATFMGAAALAAFFALLALVSGFMTWRAARRQALDIASRWRRRLGLSCVLILASIVVPQALAGSRERIKLTDDTVHIWTPAIALSGLVAIYLVGGRRSSANDPAG